MAPPTRALQHIELQEIAEFIVDTLLDLETTAVTNFNNYSTAVGNSGSDFSDDQLKGARFVRDRMAASMDRSAIQAILNPWITAYNHHEVGTPERDFRRGLPRIYDFWFTNDITIESRKPTFGTVVVGGANVGDTILHRLTVDKRGFDLEGIHDDLKTWECTTDSNTSANPFEEQFTIRGANAGRDALAVAGSGLRVKHTVKSGRRDDANGSLLRNSTLSIGTYSTNPAPGVPQTPTSIDGWTFGDITKIQGDVDTVYRVGMVGDTTPTSLRFIDNTTMSQKLKLDAQINWKRSRPAFLAFPTFRETTADGTVTLRLGATNQVFTVTALVDNDWNVLILDFDKDLYYEAWKEDDADVTFEWTGRTTGALLVAQPLLCEWQFLDGTWTLLISGQTKALVEDTYNVTDTIASDSVIQRVFARGYGFSLPHTVPATQVVAAGGRTLTFADANPDTVTASTGDFAADGYKAGMLLTVAGTASNNGTFAIASVTALVITLAAAETLVAEGPLSGGETLDARATIIDT